MMFWRFEAVGYIEAKDRNEAWEKAKEELCDHEIDVVSVASEPMEDI